MIGKPLQSMSVPYVLAAGRQGHACHAGALGIGPTRGGRAALLAFGVFTRGGIAHRFVGRTGHTPLRPVGAYGASAT